MSSLTYSLTHPARPPIHPPHHLQETPVRKLVLEVVSPQPPSPCAGWDTKLSVVQSVQTKSTSAVPSPPELLRILGAAARRDEDRAREPQVARRVAVVAQLQRLDQVKGLDKAKLKVARRRLLDVHGVTILDLCLSGMLPKDVMELGVFQVCTVAPYAGQ